MRRRVGLLQVGAFVAVGFSTAQAAGPRIFAGERPGDAGAVIGTVRLTTAPEAPPPMLSPYARPRYRPPARPESSPGSAETVVVYLRSLGGEGAAVSRSPARVQQRNRTIIPRVTVVVRGGRVDFPNEDDVFHNLFSLSGPKRFNLGRYPPGESRSQVFDRTGVVRLFCDIHSEMSGVILVLDTPWFAQPDAAGEYAVEGVPPGIYMAFAWHEVAGTDSARVTVREGERTTLDFVLGG